jgi:anti-sigma regulatory factor (Ser/Thr protein kinase)
VQALEPGRMATLLYLVIEPAAGTIQFATAGHLPPLVVGLDESASYLDGGRTLPLGVLPRATYEEGTAEIEPGSTLVLYTDGLVEERGAAIDDGLEALCEAAVSGPDDPNALCDHIIDTVLAQRTVTDDVAVLVMRTTPLSAERLELVLSPDPNALRTLRRTIGRWLEATGATADESRDIQMACHETSSNAIEHGHKFGDGAVRLEALCDDGEVFVTVSDEGSWREPRDSDRGRGLKLVEAMMDSVEVEPGEDGTVVRMRRRLGARSNGAKAGAGAGRRARSGGQRAGR